MNLDDLRAWTDKLTALDAGEIRRLLRAEGIRALPGAWDRCALANFFTQKTGTPVGVSIMSDDVVRVAVLPSNAELPIEAQPYVVGGTSLSTFARQFDQRAYPELVQPHKCGVQCDCRS